MNVIVNNIEFTLKEICGSWFITSIYEETPVSIERTEYNERDVETSVIIEDAPHGLIEAFGSEVAYTIIEEVQDILETRI